MYKTPFSIDRQKLQATGQGLQGQIKASDKIDLAYTAYTIDSPHCCMIFYHGGGANHSDYTRMAQSLRDKYHIATFLFDIRGHGRSSGIRGYSPSKEQVWSDINAAIEFIKKQYPDTPIYLGGHSSGAGLILNYSSYRDQKNISGYVMVAPELGYRIAPQKIVFASVNKFAFILNKISKGYLCKTSLAVRFNYSNEQINNWGFLSGYNVHMANAVTPDDPQRELTNIKKSLFILIAGEDELIDNNKLISVLSLATKKKSQYYF